MSQSVQWFALKTSGHEKTVAQLLDQKGYEEFLPLYRTRKKWSDRLKEVHLPFFPGYVFCRFDPNQRLPILTTPGVSFIVGAGRIPIPIQDEEIAALKQIVNSGVAACPYPFVEVGDRVRIVEGPLSGLEGLLVSVRNSWRVVVSVTLLRRSLAAEVDRDWIEPMRMVRRATDCRSIPVA